MSNTVTFTPTEPVTFNDKPYPVLILRKMKAKDLVAGDLVTGETRKSFAIIASMAGVPIGVIEEMDVDDFERLSEVATSLMGKSATAALAAAKAKAETNEAP
ncbi:MAG: phage tail assembly protein [Xanthobacteraceae bacterium]